ncbi:MAG: hypothetical protein ACLR0P_00925 [Oscillospiraceae bacterium]
MARRDCLTLDNGMRLRLLSALEVLQARREAGGLARAPKEHALCSNACLLARALETEEGSPIFSGGEAVLAGLRVEEIAALAKTWSQFNREENPALTMGQEEAEALKKTSLRRGGPAALAGAESFWRAALRAGAQAMRDRDYVWCLSHLALDQEEELERLCPVCRARAAESRCPVCGAPSGQGEGAVNPAFDQERYERLRKGAKA